MATPSSGPGSIHYSAHSNPNLAHNLHYSNNGLLARSNSHPPEMFYWDGSNSPPPFQAITMYSNKETQTTSTDSNGDIDRIREFVLKHPEEVLDILGLDVDKVLCKYQRVRKSCSVPDEKGHFNLSLSENLPVSDDFTTTIVVDQDDEECPFLWNHPPESNSSDADRNSGRGQMHCGIHGSLLKHRKANFEP